MKQSKFYNVIFPLWFLLYLFPPVAFITLGANFIIDSLVILACFYGYRLAALQNDLKTFYKKSILKVWLFGFFADIIGVAILYVISGTGDFLGLPYDLGSAIDYDPLSNPAALMIVIGAMLVSALFIFIFNYYITFKKQLEEKALRFKVALTISIVTMPWTFLLPTKWFY